MRDSRDNLLKSQAKIVKKNDILLVVIILVLAIAVVALVRLSRTEGGTVVVTIGGEFYDSFDLSKDTVFTVEDGKGGFNTFEIKAGYVDMLKASCPDKICVNHKHIHYNHETIVCLPNKVVLTIESGSDNEVDAITN